MVKKNVKTSQLMDWGTYQQQAEKLPDDAATAKYVHAKKTVDQIKEWYWKSISTKKRMSLCVRGLTFVLLFAGTILPVWVQTNTTPTERVVQLQFGVACLAVAGLLQIADKVFGWSSGWIRYITTVTPLEALSTRFELDWSGCKLAKDARINANDVAQLFALAKTFVEDSLNRQGDETEK
jgi:hypothetical protein